MKNCTVPVGVPDVVDATAAVREIVLALTAQIEPPVVRAVVVMADPIVLPVPVGVALAQFVTSMLTSSEPRPLA
jgi:hypothetical protein